ncbi:Vacuolar protein sorting-associated protein 13B [Gracilariopsis chorda]|uniref:Vacuolar protein sorting-associated protein 13B n=1 Tax=Gracilariopsis chorda TaxID=448386 RepID=A0A2V3IS69_9FLOR|nr:Vacuolar protein sorting-associated protein 13B [Gracilariopsis chorda]|eukprot:PXF44944.1 Vacuolar protein sorting-associated protein 13B [Gracilariopsis chorda]
MLQNTLSALLQSVASRYAELSPSDVGIGLRGGRLVVDDVQLRADTFNGPHVPFHVLKGRAGRLRVNVPWSALTAAPVEVYLENVHLIAGPKHSYPHKPHPPSKRPTNTAHWHHTNVGRLLFNVSVEMFGIKVEYRDDQCVAVISVASLHAFSAGPDWHRRFVSFTSVLDPNTPQATAVTMRKLVRLSGVHWVMIPRSENFQHSQHPETPDHSLPSPSYEHRTIDLHSFESQAPILHGIPITVKVLLCSGTALVDSTFTPGLHADIHVDIEDPAINLTARQIRWIDYIVKAGFGLANAQQPRKTPNTTNAQSNPPTPKRRRSQPPQHPNNNNGPETDTSEPDDSAGVTHDMSISSRLEKELAHQLQSSQSKTTRSPADDPDDEYTDTTQPRGSTYDDHHQQTHYDSNDEYDEEDDLIVVRDSTSSLDADDPDPPRRGALSSFWQAIVSEDVDDTVDDAAYALGLSNDRPPEEEDVDMNPDVEEADHAESQFAREAVNAAAMAGGLTMKLVLKTPDHEAWNKVEKLQEELEEEKKVRTRLQDAEKVLHNAEQRIQEAEALIQRLRDRNEALVNELRDLENMTSQAGKNKDAMIRQMEAALAKAERNLQGMLQAKFEQEASKTITKSIQVNTYEDVREAQASALEQKDVADHSPHAEDVDVDVCDDAGNEEPQSQQEVEAANQVHTEAEEKKQLIASNPTAVEEGGEREQDAHPEPAQEVFEDEQLTNGASKEAEVTEDDEVATRSAECTPPALTEIQLGADRFRQMPEVDAPSVSISKLIADMSSKVEVSPSSRNKRMEEAICSEGLTLI